MNASAHGQGPTSTQRPADPTGFSIVEAVPALAYGAVLVLAVSMVSDSLDLRGRARFVLVADAIALAATLIVAWRSRRSTRPLTDGQANVAVSTLILAAGANTVVTMFATPDPLLVSHVAVEVLAGGAVLLSRFWMHATVVPLIGSATAALVLTRPLQTWHSQGFVLFAATVVSWLVFNGRQRMQARVIETRLAERRARELAECQRELAEQELANRVKAEREREALREQFVRAQKMEAIGVLAGGVAHDVNNSLTAIVTLAQLIRDDTTQSSIRDDADDILATARRSAALTADLLGFSRRGTIRVAPFRAERVVSSVARMLARTLPGRVTLHCREPAESVVLVGDADQLSQALVNLCINAAEATPIGGDIAMECDRVEVDTATATALGLAPGTHACISVADHGTGMDEDVRARAFEPFFTTKEKGRGTGLGLPMVWGTARSLGGSVALDSAPGKGTTIRLYLPLPDPVPVVADFDTRRSARPGALKSLRVLVVDDEPLVRATFKRMLAGLGHCVDDAASGEDALSKFAAGHKYDAVLLDVSMPGMGGAACLARLREIEPSLYVIVVSGDAGALELQRRPGASSVPILRKPISRRQLEEALSSTATGDVAAHPAENAQRLAERVEPST